MSVGTILLIVVVLMLIGAIPGERALHLVA
jgi:hypothetical protein